MLRVAVRATAASLGLAIFVDVPSKNQPHALKLKRADAAGARYRGVAANATQSRCATSSSRSTRSSRPATRRRSRL